MVNFTGQLENTIKAGSRPTNLSSDFAHIQFESHEVIPCTLVNRSTGSVVGFLGYEGSICRHGSTSKKKIFYVPISCGSDAVQSKVDKRSVAVENVTEAGKGEPDFHGFQVVILQARKGDTLYQTTDVRSLDAESNTCLDDDSTASDRVLGGLVAKYIGSEARLYLESGEGETFKSTELGILESECDYSTARGLCSTCLVAKFIGSQQGIKHLAAGGGEACQTTDESSVGTKSNTHQDDGSTGGSQESQGETCQTTESNTHQDDGSTASKNTTTDSGWAGPVRSQEDKANLFVSSQKTKIGIADPESNTHLDDGSTSTNKGFQVSENNTCHAGVLTSNADKGGSQALILKELILIILEELISKVFKDCLRLAYLHLDGPTTKESISVRNDLKGVSPTVIGVQGSSMESLPSDIVQDILCRVPAESVLECKLVCKRWETLASGSNFANMHLTRQLNHLYDGDEGDDNLAVKVEPCLFFACRIDDPDVIRTLLFNGGQLSGRISRNDGKYIYSQNLRRIYHPPMHEERLYDHLVGSCNGLVCALQPHHLMLDPIYICNPLTREYVYLPQLFVKDEDLHPDRFRLEGEGPELGGNMYGNISSGFGYISSTNEYKVVRIHYLRYDVGIVQVYTLGSGCGWRSVGIIRYRLDTSSFGVCVNDAIYWTTYDTVVAFDLAKEEFRVLPGPPCMRNRHSSDRCGLVALGRHLCLYMDKLNVEIWSLMESSGSWRMECDIDYEAVVASPEMNLRPILLTKKGEVILLYDESVLYSYDTKTTFLKMISDEAPACYFSRVEVIPHVNTFTSLEAIGENSKTYTGRPRRVRTPWDDVINELDRAALGEEIDTTCFRLR